MKKISYIVTIGFVMSMLFTGWALAASPAVQTLTPSNSTIVTGAAGYPDLDDVNVSPNVELSVNIAATLDSFAITGFNTKGNIEYGVASDTSLIYFQEAADDQAAVTATSAEDSTAFGGWATMGGGAGS